MRTICLMLLTLALSACVYTPERGHGGDPYRRDAYEVGPGQDRVLVCHKGKKTMDLPPSALNGHLNHGDYRGPCR